MSQTPRNSEPITCKIGAGITKALANKGILVMQGTEARGQYDLPIVKVTDADNAAPWGELADVEEDQGTCSVYIEGLLYPQMQASYTYVGTHNGSRVIGSGDDGLGKIATASGLGIVIEGGFTDEDSNKRVKARKF